MPMPSWDCSSGIMAVLFFLSKSVYQPMLVPPRTTGLVPAFSRRFTSGKLGEVLAPGRKADGRIREGDETGAYQLLLM